jgi:hypothetical protein
VKSEKWFLVLPVASVEEEKHDILRNSRASYQIRKLLKLEGDSEYLLAKEISSFLHRPTPDCMVSVEHGLNVVYNHALIVLRTIEPIVSKVKTILFVGKTMTKFLTAILLI